MTIQKPLSGAVALFEADGQRKPGPGRSDLLALWVRLDQPIPVPRAGIAWFATLYLLAPTVLFLAGYLHSPLTIVAAITMAGVLAWITWRSRGQDRGATVALTPRMILVFAAVALGASVLTGVVGGFRLSGDWYKHDSMLFDLSSNAWPVAYPFLGGASLIYSFAFYLPAAAVSQVFGGSVAVAHIALALWMAIGFLAVLLCAAAVLPARLRTAGSIGAMLGYCGAESLGVWLVNNQNVTTPTPWWIGTSVQYTGSFTAIRWVPQHAIAGWLLGALFVSSWREADWRAVRRISIATLAAGLWSPFALMGGAVLVLALMLRLLLRRRLPSWSVAWTSLVVALAWLPVIAFLALPAGKQKLQDGLLTPGPYVLFLVLTIGLWTVAALVTSPSRAALIPVVLTLVVLPAFCLGQFNDLVMRASFPALFALSLLAWDGVLRSTRKSGKRFVGVAVLGSAVLLAVPSALTELSWGVNMGKGIAGNVEEPRVLDQMLPQYLQASGSVPGTLIWDQYITCPTGTTSVLLGLPQDQACADAKG